MQGDKEYKYKSITEQIELRLRNKHVKITHPRKTIISSIIEINNSFTPEELFIKSHKINPGIGIATVYRTIKILEDLKLLDRKYAEDKKPEYKLVLETFQIPKEKIAGNHPDIRLKNNSNKKNNNIAVNVQLPPVNNHSLHLKEYMDFEYKDQIKKELKLEELINDITKIDEVILKHENNKNNLIQMLLDFQAEYSWLPRHVLFYVGKKLDIPLSQIYGIASFYAHFNLEPRGKYQVVVCAGTACHVRGSSALLQRIINILKINQGHTTPDYRFTLDTVNCLGCCALGPVMLFNKKYYSNPSTRQLEKLFNSIN